MACVYEKENYKNCLLIIIGVLFKVSGGDVLFKPSTVRAAGDLTIDFHVPPGNPIFTITNMKPGDPAVSRNVDVTNGGTVSRLVAVRGVRTSGLGADPKLETVLDIVITDGITPIYGTGSATGNKKLSDFFTDSGSTNGILLNTIAPSGHKTYTFSVTFPGSAGNDFQAKSVIFDLTFGEITADHLVINEVYYRVDGTHGVDSPKDRGILGVSDNNVTILISGNGKGSKNIVTVKLSDFCKVIQQNSTTVLGVTTQNSTTGKNTVTGNTNTSSTIVSGSSTSTSTTSVNGGSNVSSGCNPNKIGQNNEWVELYNPTDHDISLKNWSLMDNSGTLTVIHPNKIIKAGGFAILSKDALTWTFWTIPAGVTKVELGSQIGDGLDNAGDHLILKNPLGAEQDRMSWGIDTSGFTPPAINPVVPFGDATERIVPGFDTDTAGDWHDQHPPTIGN